MYTLQDSPVQDSPNGEITSPLKVSHVCMRIINAVCMRMQAKGLSGEYMRIYIYIYASHRWGGDYYILQAHMLSLCMYACACFHVVYHT